MLGGAHVIWIVLAGLAMVAGQLVRYKLGCIPLIVYRSLDNGEWAALYQSVR
jgi:hypothetical protein